MDTITEIPLELLRDSPFQPRKTYTGLDELAANIRAEGRIHQPLLVRPLPPKLVIVDDLVNGGLTDAEVPQDGFELVFGHRRKRGAELAGLATTPCIVRTMNDAEVRSAQMAENVQREAMKALEEAAGFQAQIDADGLTANELAEAIGKSRSYVYGRLRLLALCPTVREALLAGDIIPDVALLVARVGGEKLQQKALGYIKGKYWELEDGGGKSFRQIRDLLNEHFTLQLDGAIFDPEDEMLLPEVGHCLRCPKRSGNAPEFQDLVARPWEAELDAMTAEEFRTWNNRDRGHLRNTGAHVCTDPDCFDAKKKAHLRNQAAKLEEDGKTVVTGAKARQAIDAQGNVKGAYIAVKDVKAELKAAGGKKPEVVTIQNQRDGSTVQAYKVEDLQAAGVKNLKAKPATNTPAYYEEQRKQREEENRRVEEMAKAENAVRWAQLLKVREAIAARARTEFDLRLIAPRLLDGVGYEQRPLLAALYDVKGRELIEKNLQQLDVDALTRFMLDCALVEDLEVRPYNLKSKPEALLAVAAHYGVDLDAVRRELEAGAEGASTPSTAAQAKKKAAGAGGKKASTTMKYRCPATGATWTGRGLQPAWIKAALAGGASLNSFLSEAETAKQLRERQGVENRVRATARRAGINQTVDAGSAGDMFAETRA